jgi:hypothetical protein
MGEIAIGVRGEKSAVGRSVNPPRRIRQSAEASGNQELTVCCTEPAGVDLLRANPEAYAANLEKHFARRLQPYAWPPLTTANRRAASSSLTHNCSLRADDLRFRNSGSAHQRRGVAGAR